MKLLGHADGQCTSLGLDHAMLHYEICKYYQSTSKCQPKVLQNLTVLLMAPNQPLWTVFLWRRV